MNIFDFWRKKTEPEKIIAENIEEDYIKIGQYPESEKIKGVDYSTQYTNQQYAHKQPISRFFVPIDNQETIRRCLLLPDNMPLIAWWLNLLIDFSSSGFHLIGGAQETRLYYKNFIESDFIALPFVFKAIIKQYWLSGNVVVYWGEETPPQFIQIFHPNEVIPVWYSYNKCQLYLKSDKYQNNFLWNNNTESKNNYRLIDNNIENLPLKNIPDLWLPYIRKGEPIPLEEGTYAFITRNRDSWNQFAIPYLKPLLEHLEMYKTLLDSDFAVAYSIKYWTRLIKVVAEKIKLTPNPNDIRSPVDRAKDLIVKSFSRNADRVQTIVIDDSIEEVKDLILDPKIWDSQKYIESRWLILQHLDIPDVFSSSMGMVGGSGAYASAFIAIKKLIQKIQSAEIDMNYQFFKPLFKAIKKSQWKDEDIPELKLNLTALYDLKTILEYLKVLEERGGLSLKTMGEPVGVSVEDERLQIEKEKLGTDNIEPDIVNKPDKNINPVGRPKQTEIPTSEPEPQPRPSK